MTYSAVGQIPQNGHYSYPQHNRPGTLSEVRPGVFGQVPQNGHYSSRRTGVFGQLPQVFVSPPTENDGGLLRISPQSAPAFDWSINNTTNTNPDAGFKMDQISNATFHMSVASGIGDQWLDVYKEAGYAVLFLPPAVDKLGPNLDFFVTMDPGYIAENARFEDNAMIVVGGNEAVIEAAKVIVGGGVPAPQEPEQPSSTGGGCPEGQVGIPPFCIPVPSGFPSLPGLPGTTPSSQEPAPLPQQPPPTQQPKNGNGQIAKAGVSTPGWLLPAVVVVGAVSLFAILRATKKG